MSYVAPYTVSRGHQSREHLEILAGIEEATHHLTGSWEFGHYLERYDGPYEAGRPTGTDADWTPLIYETETLEDAEENHARHRLDTDLTGPFRRSRIVRRAVGPWEVFD